MTYNTAQYLQKYCPALYDAGEAVYSFWIEDATTSLNANITARGWGSAETLAKAQALLAAHNWTRVGSAGARDLGNGQVAAPSPGAIANQTTVRESVGFGNPGYSPAKISGVESEWSTTLYGRQLLQVIRTRPSFGSYAVSGGW